MLRANAAGCTVGSNCIVQLLLLAMQTDSPRWPRAFLYPAEVYSSLCDITGDREMWLAAHRGGAWERGTTTINHPAYPQRLPRPREALERRSQALPFITCSWRGAHPCPPQYPLAAGCLMLTALPLRGHQHLRLHQLSSLIIHQERLPILLWELTPSS